MELYLQQFQQSLDAWTSQKTNALTQITNDPNFINSLNNAANTFNQQPQYSGFTALPEVSYGASGVPTAKINWQKKQADPLADIYAQAGLSQ